MNDGITSYAEPQNQQVQSILPFDNLSKTPQKFLEFAQKMANCLMN